MSHDRLQNQFLNGLGGFLGRLRTKSPNLSRLTEFLEGDFTAWSEIRNGTTSLLEDLPRALSPIALLDRVDRLRPDTRSFLVEIVEGLWLQRHGITPLLAAIQQSLETAERYHAVIVGLGRRESQSVEELQMLLPNFEMFQAAIGELSRTISRLPHARFLP